MAWLLATIWSWSAMGLPAYFHRAVSSEIVGMAALSVQSGTWHAQGRDPKAGWLGLCLPFRPPFSSMQTNSAFSGPG